MNCPICNNTDLSDEAENCGQCGSDLVVFTHIESAKKEHISQKKSILILAALLGIVVVSWGMVGILNPDQQEVNSNKDGAITEEISPPDEQMPSPQLASNEPADVLKNENEDLKSEVASLKSEIKALKEPALSSKTTPQKEKSPSSLENIGSQDASNESTVIIHVVKRGESLWKISRKYFKNGTKAKKIAADNNLTKMKAIPIGTKLKIYK